jgi:hypothetical protein
MKLLNIQLYVKSGAGELRPQYINVNININDLCNIASVRYSKMEEATLLHYLFACIRKAIDWGRSSEANTHSASLHF